MRHTTKFATARLAGFSDGVFAIAITLLVLELKLPDAPEADFLAMLRVTAPKLEAWALSFLVIGGLWVMQHNIFSFLRGADAVLLWLNLGFLMCVSLMPWTADLIGVYRHEPLAIVTFSGVLGLAGLFMLAGWRHAARNDAEARLIAAEVSERQGAKTTLLILRVPVVAALSIGAAFLHPSLARWCWLLFPLFGALVRHHPRFHELDAATAVSVER